MYERLKISFGPLDFEDAYTKLLEVFKISYRKVIIRAETMGNYLIVAKFEDVFNRSLRAYDANGNLALYDEYLIKDFHPYEDGIFTAQGEKLFFIPDVYSLFTKIRASVERNVRTSQEALKMFEDLRELNKAVNEAKIEVYVFKDEIPTALAIKGDKLLIGTTKGKIYSLDLNEFKYILLERKHELEFLKNIYRFLKQRPKAVELYGKVVFRKQVLPITQLIPFRYGVAITVGTINPEYEKLKQAGQLNKPIPPFILDNTNFFIMPDYVGPEGRKAETYPAELVFPTLSQELARQQDRIRALWRKAEELRQQGKFEEAKKYQDEAERLSEIKTSRNFVKKVVATGWYVFVIAANQDFAAFKVVREREVHQFLPKGFNETDRFYDAIGLADGEAYFIAKDIQGYSIVYHFEPKSAKMTPIVKARRYTFTALSLTDKFLYLGYDVGLNYGLIAIPRAKIQDVINRGEILRDLENAGMSVKIPGKVSRIYPGDRMLFLILGEYDGKLLMVSQPLEVPGVSSGITSKTITKKKGFSSIYGDDEEDYFWGV